MYIIKTYLDRSAIAGIGVFAGEDIKKGAVVWELVRGFDQIFTVAQVNAMPPRAQEYIGRYAYLEKNLYYLDADHGPFTNHADNPNTIVQDECSMIAARDIKAGEEITSDYREFDEHSKEDLGF